MSYKSTTFVHHLRTDFTTGLRSCRCDTLKSLRYLLYTLPVRAIIMTDRIQYDVIDDSVIDSVESNDIPNKSSSSKDCCSMRCSQRFFPSGYCAEFKAVTKLSTPIILSQACQFFLGPVAVIFCGHLGKTELDAVALSNSMINALSVAVATGLGSACDTLFSQTFGSRKLQNMGTILQRSMLILSLGACITGSIQMNATTLLLAMGQDQDVSIVTGEYMTIMLPGATALFVYVVLQKYLQSQNIVIPILVIGAVCNLINILLHYLLVSVASMSTRGSAIAQSFSYVLMAFLTLLYIRTSGVYKGTWAGFTSKAWLDWGQFFKLSIFGLLMVCIEWWAFECCIFLTGLLDTTVQGAQAVVFVFAQVLYMPSMGIGIGASIKVGQYLGAGDADGAVTASRVSITLVTYINLVTAVILAVCRDSLPYIFTNDPDVIALAAEVFPIMSIYLIFDGLAGVCGGIFRGCGRQFEGAVIIFVGYSIGLAVGIPLLLKSELALTGYWLAMAGSIGLEGITFCILTNLTNWNKQITKTRDRLEHASTMVPDGNCSSSDGSSDPEASYPTQLIEEKNLKEQTPLLLPPKTSHHPTFYSRGLVIQRGILISCVFLVVFVAIICRATIDLRQDRGQMSSDLHGNLWNSTSPYTTESVNKSWWGSDQVKVM